MLDHTHQPPESLAGSIEFLERLRVLAHRPAYAADGVGHYAELLENGIVGDRAELRWMIENSCGWPVIVFSPQCP